MLGWSISFTGSSGSCTILGDTPCYLTSFYSHNHGLQSGEVEEGGEEERQAGGDLHGETSCHRAIVTLSVQEKDKTQSGFIPVETVAEIFRMYEVKNLFKRKFFFNP